MWKPNFGSGSVPTFPGFNGPGPDYSWERIERQDRIFPFIPAIKRSEILPLSKNELKPLLIDFKLEGNDSFKERNYMAAGEYYTCALIVAKLIENVHHEPVERETLSVLFSNRSACFLKMDTYEAAIEDCDFAISLNKSNVKAYYRKATGLKMLKRYKEAIDAARAGRQCAAAKDMKIEMQNFGDLIKEISDNMEHAASPSAGSSANPSTNPSASTMTQHQSKTQPTVTRTKPVDDVAKIPMQTAEASKPSKKKKKKKKAKKGTIGVKMTQQQHGCSEDESEDRSSSDDDDDFTIKHTGKFQALLPENLTKKAATLTYTGDMGLDDDFGLQAAKTPSEQTTSTGPSSPSITSSTSTTTNMRSPPSTTTNMRSPASTTTGIRPAALSAANMRPPFNYQTDTRLPPTMNFQPVSEHPKRSPLLADPPQHINNAPTENFVPLVVNRPLPYPFSTKYDFVFACQLCYQEAPHGFPELKCYANLPHQCTKDFLLVSVKNTLEKTWYNIRSRPKVQFGSAYRLCMQYSTGQSCRVPRPLCSFCHSEAEIDLWTLNRNGQFDLSSFVNEWQTYARAQELKRPTSWLNMPNVSKPPPLMSLRNMAPMNQPPHMAPMSQPLPHMSQPPPHMAPMSQPPPHMGPMSQPPPHMSQPPPHMTPMSQPPHMAPMSQPPYMSQPPQVSRLMPPHVHSSAGLTFSTPSLPNHSGTYLQSNPGTSDIKANSGGGVRPRIIFPLQDTHKYRILCPECLLPTEDPDVYLQQQKNHKCAENQLAVQLKGADFWRRIRERVNHRMFTGDYAICRSVEARMMCKYGDVCNFAHCPEERLLWTWEKDGIFNSVEFVQQNRSPVANYCFTPDEMFKKHPGSFLFLCQMCFMSSPCRISMQDKDYPNLCSLKAHTWEEHKLLMHLSFMKALTPIAPRPFSHKGAFFLLCHNKQFCNRRQQTACKFAHSLVERDVWLIERDHGISREELVELSQAFMMQLMNMSSVTPDNGPNPQPAATKQEPEASSVEAAAPEKCPYRVLEVCSLCWKNGRKIVQDKSRTDRCKGSGNGHMWSQNIAYLLLPENKLLRPLPKRIPRELKWVICKHVQAKRKCDYSLGGPCQFAHSNEEMDVWTWMVNNKVTTLEDLATASVAAQKLINPPAKVIAKGQAVVWATPVAPTNVITPFQLTANALYCRYCSEQCSSQREWDHHCASDQHLFNLNSDKDHQWNFRQPPWGVRGGSYILCSANQQKKCRYSDKPDMYNFCKFAHSQEELDEWKERWEWRQMKRDIARSEHLYSYMEELLEDYDTAVSGIDVLSEELPGISITCQTNHNVFLENKHSTYLWIFDIKSPASKPLLKVCLLHNQDRLHFSLIQSDLSGSAQIAEGDSFRDESHPGCYRVQVRFKGGIFGSFMQWVVLDFGTRPVLVQKLNVELGSSQTHEKVKQLRENLDFDRWTGENCQIVRYNEHKDLDQFPENLLKKYKPPSSADTIITQDSIFTELNQHNYQHKMHQLLKMEEFTRAQIISSYNLNTEIELQSLIKEEDVFIVSHQGELFAKVPLNDQLSEDTDAGKLILTCVQSVLLGKTTRSDNKVYEAVMVRKDNFDYDGRGRDYIYICISSKCVHDLELQSEHFLSVEIQFQMDRMSFCRMHLAVDLLESTDVVFPDINKMNMDWNAKKVFETSSEVLNKDQLQIVQHILDRQHSYAPPIVVFGPFGTGKTETLAQAAMVLIKEDFEARVLICTHSNSAADLYITKHFDAFIQKNKKYSVLRIYSHERRVNTVSAVVKKYCLLSADRQSFSIPIREDVLSHHIIITTLSTSLSLSRIKGLKGFFSHIFIDEAAQALECETIMPLALSLDNTRVVLTGDHLQMGPKVYSSEGKQQKFHRSLLERLYHHYEEVHASITAKSPLNILLSINYRTKMEILRFISAIFYGSPDRLHSASGLPDVDGIIPLTFYTAQGREIQDPDDTTYYNTAEIEEVVARVAELYENWPVEWGEKRQEYIGVFSPYTAQVNRIRMLLRRRKLNSVVVDRVMNIQGREFRALFLSTVRTIHLADDPSILAKSVTESDGDFGDFGFLSDNKLLNTALTRAQSFVGVVGDPLALCAIGECVTIWRNYLKHCHNLSSIKPENVTLHSVRDQVINLMNTPKGRNLAMLNALSQEFKESKVSPVNETSKSAQSVPSKKAATSKKKATITMNGSSNKQGLSEINDVGWGVDFSLEPDDIIKQLAKEAMKVCKVELEKSRTVTKGLAESTEPLVEYVRVKQNHGHAVLYYDYPKSPHVLDKKTSDSSSPGRSEVSSPRKRQLLGADDHDREFDSDDDIDSDGLSEDSVYVDLTQQQLISMMHSSPDVYRPGILHIESSSRMFVSLQSPGSEVKEVKITSRLKCGRAFHMDEVVVEILTTDDEDSQVLEDKNCLKLGQVVGILKRSINPQYRSFVCMIEEGNAGLMVPLNRGIPKIFNLSTKDRLTKIKRGHVCVYTFMKDREISFDHYEPVDLSNPMSKLFIVRYLKWDPHCYSPLGIVVGILPAGNTIDLGMDILEIEYSIPKKFREKTDAEVVRSFSKFKITQSEFVGRRDFRDHLTFTIDPEGSEDLDDALSIETLPSGQFRIGVHIADVGFFIEKGSALDQEACLRGVTYYPMNNDPIPMLPKQLSNDLCSLKAKHDRLSVSIFMTINTSAELVDTDITQCVINSDYRLTYDEAEDILDGERIDQPIVSDLEIALHRLHKIAQRWRTSRLGNQGWYQDLDVESEQTPRAHLIVEELMIKANHQVAMYLLQHIPECTPLRTQLPPNEIALDEWRQKYNEIAKSSILLTRPFLNRGNVCHCTEHCLCIRSSSEQTQNWINVNKYAWDELLVSAVDTDGSPIEELISLAADPKNCPEIMVALFHLRNLQERGNYVCSGNTPEDLQLHYDLNMMGYTHFTSPIRRYIDLIVHRLLVAILNKKPLPYNKQDIEAICSQCSDAAQKAKRYEQATDALQLASILKEKPAKFSPVVETVDEDVIQLRFPKCRGLAQLNKRIKLSQLGLAEKPILAGDVLTVQWQKRIFDLKPDRTVSGIKKTAVLNTDREIISVPIAQWRLLLFSIIQGDMEKILRNMLGAKQLATSPGQSGIFATDVSSEAADMRDNQHYCEYSLAIKPASLMRVQLVSELSKGIISPKLQLFELTPKLDLCLEHQSNPGNCFANIASDHASKPQYRDEVSYRNVWLKLTAIEAVHSSLNENDSIIIHNVNITWSRDHATINGQFTLPWSFCASRQIIFSGSNDEEDEEEEDDKEGDVETEFFDYLCVRYSNISDDAEVELAEKFNLEFDQPFTWIGHCLTTKKDANRDKGRVTITLQLHQSSLQIPDQLLNPKTARSATIEFIPKSLTSRRQEAALKGIDTATPLAKSIALGQKVPELDDGYQSQIKDFKYVEVPNFPVANQTQQMAVNNALRMSFSLIQGPPGTGKTVTGIRIAYLFVQLNRNLATNDKMSQVLFCGPSNKSVDVIAVNLKKLRTHSPKFVRVYSDTIEQQEYPLPVNILISQRSKQKLYAINDDIKPYALHIVIRDPNQCTLAQQISEFDERIKVARECGDSFTSADLEHYRNLIMHASVEVLKKCEIVLTTCNGSSSHIIKQAANFKQLIIDECGMCTEPESMVPIVSSRAEQIVLIGDHKQLRPIVLNDSCRNLGLETSLFERYASKANMLTQQYRMHEAIAEFPSLHFYENKLVCGTSEQSKPSMLKFWPNGRNKPITFVHVMGKEESLTVSTSQGSERSKSNMEEVNQAVKTATALVRRFHINPKEVVVLSQYRAQCAKIQEAFAQRSETDIGVSTVIAAQGSEWDYVILSTVRSIPKFEIEKEPTRGWRRRKLGFITDEHQINVAITRARKGLIFIGNKHLLSCDPLWKKLIGYYYQQKKVVQPNEFMN